MKRKLITLTLLVSCLLPAATMAVSGHILPGSMQDVYDTGRQSLRKDNAVWEKYAIVQRNNASEAAGEGVLNREIVMTKAGELEALLGDDINEIDEIVVKGPINDADLATLWKSSYDGRLGVIDLGEAEMEGGVIPAGAFFNASVQVDNEKGVVNVLPLVKITFPQNVTEIGATALEFATNLKEVQWPASLKKICDYAFANCVRLEMDPLVFPANLEEIEWCAFSSCISLKGEVVLPETMKSIAGTAFHQCRITKINFPESLEYVGEIALAGCDLAEVYLPDNCELESWWGGQFLNNVNLKRAHLPEKMTEIPPAIFQACMMMEEVNIPPTTERIGRNAFYFCESLEKVDLPEGLVDIGGRAFAICRKLRQLVLPSTVQKIGGSCFENCEAVREVYCAAAVPPLCEESIYSSVKKKPFDGMSADIPLYVPVGTAELYRNAWGWDYFTKIIETEKFPSSTEELMAGEAEIEAEVYTDIAGRRVSRPDKGIYIKTVRYTDGRVESSKVLK